jgi:hypothetical protein
VIGGDALGEADGAGGVVEGEGRDVAEQVDWDLPDPARLTVEQIRPIRDQISARVRALISELDS